MGLVLRLVVGRVEVVYAALEACLHDCEVLIGESNVDYEDGIVTAEERDELFDGVGVDRVCRDVWLADCLGHGLALAAGSGGDDNLVEHFGVLCALVGHDSADAAATDDYYLIHVLYVF